MLAWDIMNPFYIAEWGITNVEMTVADSEGLIADIEGAIADFEGAIADIEGAFADLMVIFLQIFSFLKWLWDLYWEIVLWVFIIITIINVFILLTVAEQEYYDITDNIANIGIMLDTFFNKTVYDFFTKYLPSGWNCMTKMVRNFPGCIPWYFLDVLGKILYAPFGFLFWLFCLQDSERSIWEIIYEIDCEFKDMSGFSLVHFPDYVMQDCYTCNLEPVPKAPPPFTWKTENVPGLIPYPWELITWGA
jgi:hypothetical protein